MLRVVDDVIRHQSGFLDSSALSWELLGNPVDEEHLAQLMVFNLLQFALKTLF